MDEKHELISWFWDTLESFSNEERILFMRFVSGRSRLPANPADISQRFQIMKVDRVSEEKMRPKTECIFRTGMLCRWFRPLLECDFVGTALLCQSVEI